MAKKKRKHKFAKRFIPKMETRYLAIVHLSPYHKGCGVTLDEWFAIQEEARTPGTDLNDYMIALRRRF